MSNINENNPQDLLTYMEIAASKGKSITFVGSASGGDQPHTVKWEELHQEARAFAAVLQARGIKPGDHVAVLGLTSRPLVTAIQAVWLAGACIVVVPIPMRMNSIGEFINQTRAHLTSSDAAALIIDPGMASFYEPREGDPPVITLDDLKQDASKTGADCYQDIERNPDRLAILQFTSGSTSAPKGVMLPHRVVCANISAMDQKVNLDVNNDVMVSWLPLYHDMGLIGILTTAMFKGCSLILSSPQDFLNNPANWMRWMSEYGGTITAGPNFSYILATRSLKRMCSSGEILDLSRVRLALNGAEPVEPDAVENFVAAARKHGFRPGAEFCAFGMAEVTIGGTFPPVMRGMVCDMVDPDLLENEKIARKPSIGKKAKRLPLLGSPLPGLEMRICDPECEHELGLRQVGELQIKGSSVTTGYYKQPEESEKLLKDGWLRTGDLGYFVKDPEGGPDELVICGRLKDVIIIAGRNIYPQDIERAAGLVEGVRPGNVIAFGIGSSRGKESIVVVAEVKNSDFASIKHNIRFRVLSACGVTPKEIVLVKKGTLPKTSSGKLQRSLCREQFRSNKLEPAEI